MQKDYSLNFEVSYQPEQHKVLQRSSAAASWARALWAERGCCTQIRRAIGSLREQERARGSQREQESKPERARERLASHLKHASTLFCCKTVKYNSVLSQNVKIRYFLSRNVQIRYFLSRNVKIRAMSPKNGINYATSWLRIFFSPDDYHDDHEDWSWLWLFQWCWSEGYKRVTSCMSIFRWGLRPLFILGMIHLRMIFWSFRLRENSSTPIFKWNRNMRIIFEWRRPEYVNWGPDLKSNDSATCKRFFEYLWLRSVNDVLIKQ